MAAPLSRNIEVLIKKAAVDPAFRKTLLAKRAGAAEEVALTLTAAEAALLGVVPEEHLKAIIARTKVRPSLRPVLLGATATAMLAALTAGAYGEDENKWELIVTGIDPGPDIPDAPLDNDIDNADDIDTPEDAGVIYGRVINEFGKPFVNAEVIIDETGQETVTNSRGFYVLSPVLPGTYTLIFDVDGYAPLNRSRIEAEVGVKTEVSLELNTKDEIRLRPVPAGILPDWPDERGE
ncbi:MAG: carboxypeptidase-like regulatory domain-containing protein [Candidatus Zixiibacteriota bacterium]|jgi:hypothetical protein